MQLHLKRRSAERQNHSSLLNKPEVAVAGEKSDVTEEITCGKDETSDVNVCCKLKVTDPRHDIEKSVNSVEFRKIHYEFDKNTFI